MATVPNSCESIAQEYEEARSLAEDLLGDWHEATGKEKSRLFFLWRAANSKASRLRVEYENCLNPPLLLPDLLPVGVSRSRSVPSSQQTFDAAAAIENQGPGAAVGPFKVTLGVEYSDYSQDPPLRVYREAELNVPATVTIEPGTFYQTTDVMKDIPINRRPGSNIPPIYDYYILVDTEGQIEETDKGNNYLHFTDHRTPPGE